MRGILEQPKLVRLLGYWNNSSQWLNHHQPSTASTWFLRNGFTFLLVFRTLEQQLQTSQGQHCSELPCVYDTGPASENMSNPFLPSWITCQGCFHYTTIIGLSNPACSLSFCSILNRACWPRHIHCLQYFAQHRVAKTRRSPWQVRALVPEISVPVTPKLLLWI